MSLGRPSVRRRALLIVRAAGLAFVAARAICGMAAETEYLSRAAAIAWALPGADRVVHERRTLTDAERRSLEADFRVRLNAALDWYTGYREDVVTGRALLLDEVGKHQPITFVVALQPDGAIRDVDVCVYREAIGDGVRRRSFLDQFRGKQEGAPIRVDRDIDGVSGATLSCRAAERAVRRAFAIGHVFAHTAPENAPGGPP